jgi:hypothetical protein
VGRAAGIANAKAIITARHLHVVLGDVVTIFSFRRRYPIQITACG